MRQIFTSTSETPRTLTQIVITAVWTVLVFLGCDWATGVIVRSISNELPEIVIGFQNVQGVETLWQFEEVGVLPIVFTGSSQMQTALSPHVFDDEVKSLSGRAMTSVNISFTGADTTLTRYVMQNLLVPAGVKTVIYGIEMRAMNIAAHPWEDTFRNSPLGYTLTLQPGVEQALSLWLIQHSNVVRYRGNIRDWLTGERINNFAAGNLADDRGYYAQRVGYFPSPNLIKTQFTPFTSDDALYQSLREIVRTCQTTTIQCIVVNMPIHQDAYKDIKPQDEATYREALHDYVIQGRVRFWDFNTDTCRNLLGSEAFSNSNHLNAAGAPRFSKALAILYVREQLNGRLPGNVDDSLANCAQVVMP